MVKVAKASRSAWRRPESVEAKRRFSGMAVAAITTHYPPPTPELASPNHSLISPLSPALLSSLHAYMQRHRAVRLFTAVVSLARLAVGSAAHTRTQSEMRPGQSCHVPELLRRRSLACKYTSACAACRTHTLPCRPAVETRQHRHSCVPLTCPFQRPAASRGG